MDPAMPATLGDAIGTEPAWLQGWILVLGAAHITALAFVVGHDNGRWVVRPEPIAVVASAIVATMIMTWLYSQVGYVRLLGLAHLACWTPVYLWMWSRRRALVRGTLFTKWVQAYLIIVGLSLAIDVVDVIRHLVGDGELLHRWS